MEQMAVTKLPTKKYDILRCGVSHVLGKSTPRLECDQGLVYAVNPWLRVCGGGFLGLSPLRGRYAGWGAGYCIQLLFIQNSLIFLRSLVFDRRTSLMYTFLSMD